MQTLPGPLPGFLRPLQEAYMQTGLQLRMLQRLQPLESSTVERMTTSAAAEVAVVSALAADDSGLDGSGAFGSAPGNSCQGQQAHHGSLSPACSLSFSPIVLLQVGCKPFLVLRDMLMVPVPPGHCRSEDRDAKSYNPADSDML